MKLGLLASGGDFRLSLRSVVGMKRGLTRMNLSYINIPMRLISAGFTATTGGL